MTHITIYGIVKTEFRLDCEDAACADQPADGLSIRHVHTLKRRLKWNVEIVAAVRAVRRKRPRSPLKNPQSPQENRLNDPNSQSDTLAERKIKI
jgi:hypothetical protein